MALGLRAVATTPSPLASARSVTRAPNPREAPVISQVFIDCSFHLKDVSVHFTLAEFLNRSGRTYRSPAKRSGQHLGEFDQIAKRVGEESELAADGGQNERRGDDDDATRAKLGDRFIHAANGKAEMVVAAIFQAIAKVRIGPHFRGKPVAASEHLDVEMIVRRRRQISELLVGIRPFRYDAEIELADIEILSLRQTRRTHRHMVAAHIGEG